MNTVCTINKVKLKNSPVLISQLSITLHSTSRSPPDTRRNLMGFYSSQPKKSPWKTSSTQTSQSQEFCFIPLLNIFTAWTISESHIPNVNGICWMYLVPSNLAALLDFWPHVMGFFWGVLCIEPRSDSSFIFQDLIPVSFSVQAVRTQALCFSSLCDLNPQMEMLRSETGLIWLQMESETNYSTDVSKKLLSVISHLWSPAGFACLDVSIRHNYSCHPAAVLWVKRRLWEGIVVQTCWLLICRRAQFQVISDKMPKVSKDIIEL